MFFVKFEISSSSDLKWVCITRMVKNTEETPIASIKFKNTAEKKKKYTLQKSMNVYCLKYFLGNQDTENSLNECKIK